MKKKSIGIWWGMLRSTSLKRRMIGTLVAIAVQSVTVAGLVIWLGSTYLQSLNATMQDCYQINRLLSAYTAEMDAFDTYVLYQDGVSEAAWLQSSAETDACFLSAGVSCRQSREMYVLFTASETSLKSFRAGCEDTLALALSGKDYAATYAKLLRVGEYIRSYLQTLLHTAISYGQAVYQKDMALIEQIPILFTFSVIALIFGMAIWTRWTLRHVIAPIHELTRATGEMTENHYDLPDIKAYEDNEITQLTQMFNKMRHSTQKLVESLREKGEMEARLREEAVRRMKTESAMDSLRLSLLQSQINPHFLFNTLNIISRMAQMEDAPTTEELIKRLSNLFRYNLQSVENVVPLSAELKIVNDYIAIQKIRFGDRIRFEIDAQADVQEMKVPIFTLQPLMENAVIHGVAPLEEGGEVRASMDKKGDMLVITVSDTGQGITPERLTELMDSAFDPGRHVSGLGVGNVRARIAAYREGSAFEIRSLPGSGTTIVIKIPLTREEMIHV